VLKVAHISDLHYNAATAHRVASVIASARAVGVDHLIISGDLAASAHRDEFTALRQCLDAYGFIHSDSLTIVPGNHDIFGFIYQTFDHPDAVTGGVKDLHSFASTVRTLWRFRRQLLQYDRVAYSRDLIHFRSHFPHAFANHITVPGHAHGFPFAKLLPHDIVLVGVDTNHYLPKVANLVRMLRAAPSTLRSRDISLMGENLSGSTGYVNIESLATLLEHPQVRHRRKLLVMHHYLYSDDAIGDAMTSAVMYEMRLANRQQVVQLLGDHRIDVVLHGHLHVTDQYRVGRARVVNGGGSLWNGMNILEIGDQHVGVTLGVASGHVRT
jgi:3',5'-cyclic AMP phosphodiesterase CpdA